MELNAHYCKGYGAVPYLLFILFRHLECNRDTGIEQWIINLSSPQNHRVENYAFGKFLATARIVDSIVPSLDPCVLI